MVSLNPIEMAIRFGVPFSVELYEGNINGVAKFFPLRAVEADLSGIQINRNLYLRGLDLIRSNPELMGSIRFDGQQAVEVDLSLNQTTLSGNPKGLPIPMKIPDIRLSSINSNLVLNKNLADIQLTTEGVVQMRLGGSIQLNQKRLDQSKLNVNINVSFDKQFSDRLGFVNQMLNSYRNKQGAVAIAVSGTFRNPGVKKR